MDEGIIICRQSVDNIINAFLRNRSRWIANVSKYELEDYSIGASVCSCFSQTLNCNQVGAWWEIIILILV